MAESKLIDSYMHAMGHSIAAEDSAQAGLEDLISGNNTASHQHLLEAVGKLSAAITGMISARVSELGADFGIDRE